MKITFREWDFPVPTRVVSGRNLIEILGIFLPGAVAKARVTVVIGRGSVRKSGLLDRLLAALRKQDLHVDLLEGVEENPSWQTCLRGRDHLLQQGTELVIALGGGSVLDAAKAMALAARNAGSLAELIERKNYLRDPLPLVAIPTTAGTGSEVTPYCIITDEHARDKLNLHTPHSYPGVAILDPVCTLSMPETLAVGTGMDALSHAVEGYLSRRASTESDGLALESIEMIGKYLVPSIRQPRNLELHEKMLLAATKAGVVIAQTGTILLHALSYRLTLDHGVHHGLANAILLHPFLGVTQKYQSRRVQKILDALLGGGATLEGLKDYLAGLAVRTDMGHYGVRPTEFETIAGYVLAKKNLADTPFAVTPEDIYEILTLAGSGPSLPMLNKSLE